MLSALYSHCYLSHSHKSTNKKRHTIATQVLCEDTRGTNSSVTPWLIFHRMTPVDHKSISGTAPQGSVSIFYVKSAKDVIKSSTLNETKQENSAGLYAG